MKHKITKKTLQMFGGTTCPANCRVRDLVRLLLLSPLAMIPGSLPTSAQEVNNEISTSESAIHEIGASKAQPYPVKLKASEFFQVHVEQFDVDVELTLFDPDHREVAWMDSPNGKNGPETLSFIATKAGLYTLEISILPGSDSPGRYSIRQEAVRTPTEQDLARTGIERRFAEGVRFAKEKKTKQAQASLRDTLVGWQRLNDAYMKKMTNDLLVVVLLDEAKRISDGNSYLRTENLLKEAVASAAEALDICQSSGDKYCESRSRLVIGDIYADTQTPKHFQEALDHYQKAIEVIDSAGLPESETRPLKALILKGRGEVLANQGKGEDSLAAFRQALALVPPGEGDSLRASLLMRIGNELVSLRGFAEAEEQYKKAREIDQAMKAFCDEGVVLSKMGELYGREDNESDTATVSAKDAFTEAEAAFEHCAKSADYINRRVFNLRLLADVYEKMRNHTKALVYERQANALSKDASVQPEIELIELYNEGMKAKSRDPEKGLEILTRVLNALEQREIDISIRAEILKQISFARVKLSRIYRARGMKAKGAAELQLGAQAFGKAFELVKDLEDKAPLAKLLSDFASALLNGGVREKALEMQLAALGTYMSKENKSRGVDFELFANITYALAEAYLANEKVDEAQHYFRIALWLETTFGTKQEIANTLAGLMNVFDKLGKRRLAIFYGKQAVRLNLQFRASIKSLDVDTQRDYLQGNSSMYESLARLLIEEGRLAEAHQVINRYQDQEFFDFAPEKSGDFENLTFRKREEEAMAGFDGIAAALREIGALMKNLNPLVRIRKLTEQELEDLEKRRDSFVKSSKEFEAKLIRIETEFNRPDAAQDELGPSSNRFKPNARDCEKLVPASLGSRDTDKMRTVLCRLEEALGERVAVIHTLSTDDALRVLLITSSGIKSFSSPITGRELSGDVERVLAHLQKPDEDVPSFSNDLRNNSDWFNQSFTLYKAIFRSAAKEAGGDTLESTLEKGKYNSLLWSLDDPLRNIPVNALYNADKRRYLIEEYQNSVFTRSSPEQFLSEPKRWTSCLGAGTAKAHMGLPPLTLVTEDLKFLCGNNLLLDEDFTPGKLSHAIQSSRPSVVIVLTHFVLFRGDADNSILVTGDDSGYSLRQMAAAPGLFAGVDLLVLGACKTGTEEPGPLGDQTDGLAELAQRLGARAVIATLWSVSPEGTSRLVRDFGQLHNANLEWSKIKALRNAQLNLLRRKVTDPKRPLDHPYYWAPFVLYGNFQ